MAQRITIQIDKKIATCLTELPIVCGNSNYEVEFVFDEEWDNYNVKTAVFVVNGKSTPKVFEGNVTNIPAVQEALILWVGVFAGTIDDGTLSTTTPALVRCKPCVTDGDNVPAPPPDDVYNQLLKKCQTAVETAEKVEKRANNGEFDGKDADVSQLVPRMATLGDILAEEHLGNKYHRLYCERNKKDIDGDGIPDERGTYARICITEIPIPPPDPDIYSEDADPALLEAYEAKQYGEHISLHSIPLRTNQGDLRVPARTIEEAELLDLNNAKEFALSIYGAKRAFVPKLTLEEGDSNRYAYTVTRNSKGEMAVQLIKMGANPTADVNQPLIRRRTNGAVGTLKNPQADDDAASKLYVDTLGNAILAGLDSIITAQNELLGG